VLRSAASETESAISPSSWADWHPAIKPKMTTNNIVRIFVSDASGQIMMRQDEDCDGATL
jgi:hypothetical protein